MDIGDVIVTVRDDALAEFVHRDGFNSIVMLAAGGHGDNLILSVFGSGMVNDVPATVAGWWRVCLRSGDVTRGSIAYHGLDGVKMEGPPDGQSDLAGGFVRMCVAHPQFGRFIYDNLDLVEGSAALWPLTFQAAE